MNSINLIPVAIRQAKARRERLIRWSASALLSALLAAIPYSITLTRKAQAAQAQRVLESLEDEASAMRTTVRLETARTAEAFSELERSRALRAKRSWSAMIALVARCLPDDCWLASVATDPDAPSVAAPRLAPDAPRAGASPSAPRPPETVVIEAPQKLRLVGHSTSDGPPLVLVSRLMESNVFSRVALEKTLRVPATSGVAEDLLYQFEIVCEW